MSLDAEMLVEIRYESSSGLPSVRLHCRTSDGAIITLVNWQRRQSLVTVSRESEGLLLQDEEAAVLLRLFSSLQRSL